VFLIVIIYNSTILVQWIRVMIVRWQSDLVNTKESVLPVCDKPYQTNKRKIQKREEIEVLQSYALIHKNINRTHIMMTHVSVCQIQGLPRQLLLSGPSVKPRGHSHRKLPWLLMHCPSRQMSGWLLHSSMSETQAGANIRPNYYTNSKWLICSWLHIILLFITC